MPPEVVTGQDRQKGAGRRRERLSLAVFPVPGVLGFENDQ
jgi:hypothetical protein